MMTTYRRLDHVKKTVAALQANHLAKDSRLYIASDGPLPEHEREVMLAREYLATVDGFLSVEVLPRSVNSRVGNWQLRRRLLKQHGRIIMVEEDCVTSPWFLTYMNACLDRFRDRDDLFSVSGYLPPIPALQRQPLCLLQLGRFNAWGFGIWRRSDELVNERLTLGEYEAALGDRLFRRQVANETGLNLYGMWKRIAEGKLFAYDAMANYEIVRRGKSVLYPSQSLVHNIGFDGTGEHCGTSDRFEVKQFASEILAARDLEVVVSPQLRRKLADFYGGGWLLRAKFNSKRIRGRMNADRATGPGSNG